MKAIEQYFLVTVCFTFQCGSNVPPSPHYWEQETVILSSLLRTGDERNKWDTKANSAEEIITIFKHRYEQLVAYPR